MPSFFHQILKILSYLSINLLSLIKFLNLFKSPSEACGVRRRCPLELPSESPRKPPPNSSLSLWPFNLIKILNFLSNSLKSYLIYQGETQGLKISSKSISVFKFPFGGRQFSPPLAPGTPFGIAAETPVKSLYVASCDKLAVFHGFVRISLRQIVWGAALAPGTPFGIAAENPADSSQSL